MAIKENASEERGELILEVVTDFLPFIQTFFENLYSNFLLIPFTISFSAAILITIIYFASFISDTLIKMLLVPLWILVIITYFFPTTIPKNYELASLILFAAMIGSITLVIKRSHNKGRSTRIDKALSEVVSRMKANNLLNQNHEINEDSIKNLIKESFKKNKIKVA
jgi:hypothetical protein